MKVSDKLSSLHRKRRPIVLAAGFFDGVHLGHRRVLSKAVCMAAEKRGEAWVLTFSTHPLHVLRPHAAPSLLTSARHKLGLLATLGVDGCLTIPFTRELAELEPEDFVRQLRASMPTLTDILVGRNWRFGRAGRGNPASLSRMGRQMGFRLTVVRPVVRRGHVVSSTRIREALRRGRLGAASDLLGRPFSVLGRVRRGNTRGRKLGFPTANLDVQNEVLPPLGVYAVQAVLTGGTARRRSTPDLLDGVCNLGLRPTFETAAQPAPLLELHLFDFDQPLYGREIEVFFLHKLRQEMKFASQGQLRRQIARDVVAAGAALRSGGGQGKKSKNHFTPSERAYYSPAQT